MKESFSSESKAEAQQSHIETIHPGSFSEKVAGRVVGEQGVSKDILKFSNAKSVARKRTDIDKNHS